MLLGSRGLRAIALAFGLVMLASAPSAASTTSAAFPVAGPVDYVVVEKRNRVMTLWSGGRVVKSYRIALGRNPVGAKVVEGDGRTPEGIYLIDGRNPDSDFHLSLSISYPNYFDAARARDLGASPGGAIVIHGLPESGKWAGETHRLVDWTEGCIAVTDREIEEIWSLVPDGTLIEIRP